MNITVYLGANNGNERMRQAAEQLGTWIGQNGNQLVYGGSKSGLMVILAEAALRAGGKVIGVEPKAFVDDCLQLEGITKLIVTENMTERKARMIELGDAFIAFPGGTGTLEEIAEVMSKNALGQLDGPCIFFNLEGYYNSLRNQLETMISYGLSSSKRQEGIYFCDTLEDVLAHIEGH